MRAKTHIALLAGLLILVLGMHSASNLSAQTQDFSLTTSPLPINLATSPGKTVSTDLRIKNNSSSTQRLKVSLYKFSVNEFSEVRITEPVATDDFIKWVSFSPSTFDAAPNEWRTIKMTIDVPSDAALGYYYAVGFSQAGTPRAQPGTATLQGQVITFVLLDVQVPGAKRELKVTSFKSSRSSYEFLPATFSVTVQNTGNIHLVPSGDIFISRGGKSLTSLPINPGRSNILPNSSRTFTVEWKDGFPLYEPKIRDGNPLIDPKTNTIDTQLRWNFDNPLSKFRAGPYNAKMLLVYDDGTRDVPVEGKLGFWVIPWRILAGFILLLAVMGFFIYRYRRLRKRLKAYQKRESKASKEGGK